MIIATTIRMPSHGVWEPTARRVPRLRRNQWSIVSGSSRTQRERRLIGASVRYAMARPKTIVATGMAVVMVRNNGNGDIGSPVDAEELTDRVPVALGVVNSHSATCLSPPGEWLRATSDLPEGPVTRQSGGAL